MNLSGLGGPIIIPSLFHRFTSNKTQLTEFPESKSDMPLFHWVLALKLNKEEKNISHVQKSAVECLENGNYHVYRKLFPAKQHFLKCIPAQGNCQNQEINRIKLKKIK